jgi:hypothetical protein
MPEDLFGKYFFVSFVALWAFVTSLIAMLGGWLQLSHDYRADRNFSGKQWWFQSAGFRFSANYGSCLIIGANSEGLRISVLFPFRIGHPPLFIPWSEFSITRGRSWFFRVVRLVPRRHPSVKITLSERLISKIESEIASSVEERAAA